MTRRAEAPLDATEILILYIFISGNLRMDVCLKCVYGECRLSMQQSFHTLWESIIFFQCLQTCSTTADHHMSQFLRQMLPQQQMAARS